MSEASESLGRENLIYIPLSGPVLTFPNSQRHLLQMYGGCNIIGYENIPHTRVLCNLYDSWIYDQ